MEGIGALRLLDTHLHIMILGIYKIYGMCIHTHQCTKAHGYLFIDSCLIIVRAKICIRLHSISLSLKLSAISNHPIVKINSTHAVPRHLLCFKSLTDLTLSKQ